MSPPDAERGPGKGPVQIAPATATNPRRIVVGGCRTNRDVLADFKAGRWKDQPEHTREAIRRIVNDPKLDEAERVSRIAALDGSLANGQLTANGGRAANGDTPGDELAVWEPVDLGPAWRGEKLWPQAVVFSRSDGVALLAPGINYLHGDSGDGKSFLAAIVALGELRAERHCLWVTYEDATEEVLVGRLRQLGATWDDVARLHFFTADEPLSGGVAPLVELVQQTEARLLVLDSVGEAMAVGGINEDRDNEVGPWLRQTLPRHPPGVPGHRPVAD